MQAFIKKATDRPFLLLWLCVFILYLPAWRAGFVTDAIDWLNDIHSLSFKDYLNRPHSTIHSLYQFTQLITFCIYKIQGTSRIPWFLLMISLQSVNGWLLYRICRQIFEDAGLKRAAGTAMLGGIFFCVSPYLSEVLVWKACFHYLQSFLMMLSIVRCVQLYLHQPRKYLVWVAAILFFVSSFALEIFYLTPIFTISLIFFYYRSLRWNQGSFKRVALLFFVPQLLLFAVHLLLFHLYYHEWISHGNGGIADVPLIEHFSKAARYAFHVLLFGRFWPQQMKEHVYLLCKRPIVIWIFFGLVAALTLITFYRSGDTARKRVLALLLFWLIAATAFVLPMPVESLFDLAGNRYLYLVVAFTAMALAFLIQGIRQRLFAIGIAAIWIVVSGFLTLRTNRHWQTSERISEKLLQNVPAANGRTMIMLSLPYCYKGIPMINAFPYGNFKRMHNMLQPIAIMEQEYDGAAFNMNSPGDGSVAEFTNDSTVKVTLNQWGTWWWYMDFGGYSYQTADYRIDMRDQGHWYEMVLKKPRADYLLLYQNGDHWMELK